MRDLNDIYETLRRWAERVSNFIEACRRAIAAAKRGVARGKGRQQ